MLYPAIGSGRRALFLRCAACALSAGQPALAQEPATVEVTVDATAAGTPLGRVWNYYGFDEVNYSTSATGRELLRTLGSLDPGSPHIRSHFLLNSGDGTPSFKWGSTNVYTEDASGNPAYSWTLMDGIMDAVTAAGTLPLVEIGFMPHDLAAPPTEPYQNSSAYILDGRCFNPPKDLQKWRELIRAWAAHVRDRYPKVEDSWEWELWNEPDIGYWKGKPEQYLALYDHTEAALHSILPKAPIGGPAVAYAGAPLLLQFLEHCATGTNAVTGATGTRLDLVSFHAKGGVARVDGHVEMNLGNQLRLHQTGFNAVAATTQYRQTPIVITEADPDGCAACSAATYPENAYRNSPAYGAYEVAMMKRTLELASRIGVNLRGLLTWAFLFDGTPYFAGYRALATHGIHLPVLNAFKLLGKLGTNRVPATSSGSLSLDELLKNSVRSEPDVDAMATRDGQQISVLVWNYHDALVAVPATPVHLTIAVPESFGARALTTHLRVDDTHGNAYGVWGSQGSPATPTPEQIAALQQAMEPSSVAPPGTVGVVSGSVSIEFALPRFGISLITLTPAGAAGMPGGISPWGNGGAGGEASPAPLTGEEKSHSSCLCQPTPPKVPFAGSALALAMLGGALLSRRPHQSR